MDKIQIKNRYDNSVIYETEAKTIKKAVEKAVQENVNFWRADLSEADLFEADLSEADLREANLSEADLREANLREANLSEADLREANLREANLSEADLREADLFEADLSEADLREANLSEADLNCIFFKTKVTEKQKKQIIESDLFEVKKKMDKEELKTLRDLSVDIDNQWIRRDELKAEAIKWIKWKEDDVTLKNNVIDWIKHFFNITEEDLK